MKIGASTLAGLEIGLEKTLEFIENLGLEYAELVHQFPTEHIAADILESYNLKYSIHKSLKWTHQQLYKHHQGNISLPKMRQVPDEQQRIRHQLHWPSQWNL